MRHAPGPFEPMGDGSRSDLERTIEDYGPERVAAVVVEPIVGEGGHVLGADYPPARQGPDLRVRAARRGGAVRREIRVYGGLTIALLHANRPGLRGMAEQLAVAARSTVRSALPAD
ncbi:hypothetical protein [Plantactinospora sp. B6F1]|uniref:hypothetical protein n=1 Tax=Plantactinospora sp. B6F1 TaxID=3158971 RepID=UPI0032D92A7E